MLRVLVAILFGFLWVGAGLAQSVTPVSRAMEAVRAKNWEQAAREVRSQGQVSKDIVEWHRLRAGHGTASEVLAFLERRPDWPGLPYLRKRSEDAFSGLPAGKIIEFYKYGNAQTPQGVLDQAYVEIKSGNGEVGRGLLINAWKTMAIGPQTHQKYLDAHGELLRPHHTARMDHVLWRGWENNAKRMRPLVSEEWRKLADARIGLRARVKGVDGLIAAVPAALQSDPGLAYERFVWRARKGRHASAIEVLLERSQAKTLGQPEDWSRRRRDLARRMMRAGNYNTAYQIASTHGLTPDDGYAYSDCEWISGYIALRFLNKPGVAAEHFVRFTSSVETPISLGRGEYWQGRAQEAMGNTEAAQRAYSRGGAHQTSFYGLLAAEKAGMPPDPALAGNEVFPNWRKASYTNSSVHHAALLFLEAGELSLAERFWVHLSETQERQALGQMGTMAQDLGAPHIAVMLSKKMVRRGVVLPGSYYPLHPMVNTSHPVPVEMALSIARRESEFDPVVVSGAGARGLMQVMPGTARQVAAAIGEVYSHSWLTSKPEYNTKLGTAYLAGLADQFDGNVIMMSAGYNAGPGRPVRWMSERGDPRHGGMDIVDWIEHIPFNETRNYVMRVSESLPVYRARLGKNPHPVPFSQELVGSTVRATR